MFLISKKSVKNYKFTIFTPCFNGAVTINRVFSSMEKQTYANFEWFIVNDGSTDNSKTTIIDLINNSTIKDKITFIDQENCGKHISWNKVAGLADSDYFICADCDDSFVDISLEFLNEKANYIEDLNDSTIVGINVCTRDPNTGNMKCDPYPKDGLICDYIELEYKYKCTGEHWYINKTNEIKQIVFPNIKSRFYPENRVWFALSVKGLKQICFNACLRDYYFSPNGLCANRDWQWRIDIKKAKMYLHYYAWMVFVPGRRIFNISPLAFFRRIRMLIVQFFKYLFLLVLNVFTAHTRG